MKKLTFPVCLAVAFMLHVQLSAQKEISVITTTLTMSQGDQPAYVVEIPEGNYETTHKNWEKKIRQNTKNKIVEKDHELFMEGTLIEEIYNKPMNIYSAIIKGDSSLKLVAVFEIDSVFFDHATAEESLQSEKINSQIKHYLQNFASLQYMYAVEDELGREEAVLKEKQKDLAGLAKENENLLKKIAENEQNIRNSEDAISSYELDNERKQNEINAKKESLSGISNDPQLAEQAKDQLKSLEKEKKNLENKLEKEQKNLVEYQANIESLNTEVERNLELQTAKKEEIDKQELVVEDVRKKLNGIK